MCLAEVVNAVLMCCHETATASQLFTPVLILTLVMHSICSTLRVCANIGVESSLTEMLFLPARMISTITVGLK